MNHTFRLILLLPICFPLLYSAPTPANPLPFSLKCRPVKNVIILIPDGCGTAHMTIARWCKKQPLAQDALHAGLVNTYSANSAITGSAAAATALATGFKTWEDDTKASCLSLRPDAVLLPTAEKLPPDQAWRPAATLLEGARLSGRSTGIVANCNINHATPAAFSSHWHDRDSGNVITKQQVFENIDVVLAGGRANLLPSSIPGGKRTDGENLIDVLKQRGYSVITTDDELNRLPKTTKKVWGAFADNHLRYDIDRRHSGKTEPSLVNRTKKAIDLLSRNRKGFFLLVEGSEVDWASHNNDPVGVATEYLAFDSAVTAALDFARADGNTEVLIFPDHDNGGMSLGMRGDDYTSTDPDRFVNTLGACKMTCAGLLDSLISCSKTHGPVDWRIVADHLKSIMNIDSIAHDDNVFSIAESVNKSLTEKEDVAKIGAVVSRRCNIGWTTIGHTGSNVPMYSLLLQNNGTFDNTDLARYGAHIMGFDLNKVNETLIAATDELFDGKRMTVSIDSVLAAEGRGSLTVQQGKAAATFPFYKDFFVAGSDTVMLPGLTLYSPKRNTVYVPRAARNLLTGALR